jgi:hypothetical protein
MSEAAAVASTDFVQFIATYEDVSDGDNWNDFFTAWLEQGDAVLETGGDFGCYMQAVLYTIAWYQETPSILDYWGEGGYYKFPIGEDYTERRVKGYFPDFRELYDKANLCFGFVKASAFDADHYRVIYAHRVAGVPNPWKET